MKKIILFLIFQVCTISLFGQNCGKTNISAELELKIKTDSIYKSDVRFRTEYYVKLTKSILPKYFGLKENIQQKLKPEDSAILENIVLPMKIIGVNILVNSKKLNLEYIKIL